MSLIGKVKRRVARIHSYGGTGQTSRRLWHTSLAGFRSRRQRMPRPPHDLRAGGRIGDAILRLLHNIRPQVSSQHAPRRSTKAKIARLGPCAATATVRRGHVFSSPCGSTATPTG